MWNSELGIWGTEVVSLTTVLTLPLLIGLLRNSSRQEQFFFLRFSRQGLHKVEVTPRHATQATSQRDEATFLPFPSTKRTELPVDRS